MEKKLSYFYVLHCKDDSFYGGYTTDLKRREKEHNDGVGAKYTKPKFRRPLKMIYAASFATRSEATKAEYAFKKQTRLQKINFLKKAGVVFPIDNQQICVINSEEVSGDDSKSKELS
ncbi:GIY-YIG nuclease family protein [Carnobacterium gallinarum]|uniref:GIY-YIG nuclease family protein n=1 Tax=Carnobacterium gallinarum TaxID=2749 RepID=UPI00054D171F|nr:GIY-YIG nuclease family protein [Carnobacterium gallinarum]